MDKHLFWPIDEKHDPHWIIKRFFNYIYFKGDFLWTLPLLLKKDGCCISEEFCFFPDFEDPDPEGHFEGVMFGTFNAEVIVPEAVAFDYVRQACDKYVQLHPEAKQEVDMLWNLFFIE